MLGRLFPFLLALAGLVAGTGTGYLLRPEAAPAEIGAAPANAHAAHEPSGDGVAGADEPLHDYVKLNNQFVVPVVEDGRVASLVILSLSLEVPTGAGEKVYTVEPKLRDTFLQVLFDHANSGGFRGIFTDGSNMIPLRRALLEAAIRTLGPDVIDVLIVDIVRQDS